jgi:hypothetical protein
MGMKKIELGPIGLAVARNVRRFRGDTSYAELSRKLAERGRPIPPLGLRHLEAGTRQVSVDELVALAMALDVAPLTLLLPDPDPQRLVGKIRAYEVLQLLISGPKGLGPAVLDALSSTVEDMKPEKKAGPRNGDN